MWNNAQLKIRAKTELKKSYWPSFLVCLLGGFFMAEISNMYLFSNRVESYQRVQHLVLNQYSFNAFRSFLISNLSSLISQLDDGLFWFVVTILLLALLPVIIGLILYSAFLSGPVTVGLKGYFISAPYGNRKFSNVFSGFKNKKYMKNVKNMFMKNLFIFLWSLLFFIPGIIKHYEYYMVPYILNDLPDLSSKEAIKYSKRMTDGHKFDIFVLEFSFIGWILLAAFISAAALNILNGGLDKYLVYLIGGMGMMFLVPYMEATKAQLYIELRYQMFNSQQYYHNVQ